MSTATAKESQNQISLPSFTVEADHPRNCDLIIQAIPGCRLRGSIDGSRHVVDAKTGDLRVPIDQARALASFPRTPGMHLQVDPTRLTYRIVDPIYKNEAILTRMKTHFREAGKGKVEIEGLPPQEGKLDKDRMKTLCRELVELVQLNHAKVVAGSLPDLEDVEGLPGEFLLNPGASVQNTQPRYEKDFESWVDNLSRQGG